MSLRGSFRRALGQLPPAVILLAAWLVLVIYAYPGQMTTDSFDHLAEARAGIYTDSHPPITSLVWKLVEYVIAGAFGMLIVQSLAFLLGLYALLRHTLTPRGTAWAAALLFVFPPILLPFSVIWKDCLMAGFLMLGTAGLVATSLRLRLAGLAALVLATGFRYNAAAATLPLIVLLFQWRLGLHWLKRAAIGVAAWLAVTVIAFALNGALTDRPMHFWHSSSAIYDIAGTIAHVDAAVPDAELERALAGTGLVVHDHIQDHLRAAFDPRDFLPLIGDSPRRIWDLPRIATPISPRPPATRSPARGPSSCRATPPRTCATASPSWPRSSRSPTRAPPASCRAATSRWWSSRGPRTSRPACRPSSTG